MLRKRVQPEILHHGRGGGLHLRPKPGGAKVKTIFRRRAVLIYGKDAAAEALACLKQEKIDARRVQELTCAKPREPTSNDGDLGFQLSLSLWLESALKTIVSEP